MHEKILKIIVKISKGFFNSSINELTTGTFFCFSFDDSPSDVGDGGPFPQFPARSSMIDKSRVLELGLRPGVKITCLKSCITASTFEGTIESNILPVNCSFKQNISVYSFYLFCVYLSFLKLQYN